MDRGGGIVNVCGERGELRLLRHLHHCEGWADHGSRPFKVVTDLSEGTPIYSKD